MDRQTHRQTDTGHRETDSQSHKMINRQEQTNKYRDRHTDIQTLSKDTDPG